MKLALKTGSRSRVLAVLIFIAMLIFVVRLFYLQIIKHDYYVNQANAEQVKKLTVKANRGQIYGLSNGGPIPLVMNQTVYTVYADPTTITKNEESKVISSIESIAGGNAKSNLASLIEDKKSRYQILATDLTLDQATKLKSKDLSGVGFQKAIKRVYPEGALASQTLGFVNSNGEGQYGVEGALNSELEGKDGILQSVTDVKDVPLTIGNNNVKKAAVDGKNVVLTIDGNVQSYVEKVLSEEMPKVGANDASVIVMNPNNGQIYAMANSPSFDVSNYTNTKDVSTFANKVVSYPFEPASVMKTYVMATALNEGVITPSSTYNNVDSITVDGTKIVNAALGHRGILTMQDVLDWSLNTGSVTVAERLGGSTTTVDQKARETMYDYYYNKLGLGRYTGVEVAGEAQGTVVKPNTGDGDGVRYSNMSFGQGLDVTMVQVVAGFSAIINGGSYYKPTVVAGEVNSNGDYKANKVEPIKTNIVKQSTSDYLKTMLQKARSSAPFLTTEDKKGYIIGGKTGTAQTIENGKYVFNQTDGTYLGFGATSDNKPQYVIMVRVSAKNKQLEGGDNANPIFSKIARYMVDYLRLPAGNN